MWIAAPILTSHGIKGFWSTVLPVSTNVTLLALRSVHISLPRLYNLRRQHQSVTQYLLYCREKIQLCMENALEQPLIFVTLIRYYGICFTASEEISRQQFLPWDSSRQNVPQPCRSKRNSSSALKELTRARQSPFKLAGTWWTHKYVVTKSLYVVAYVISSSCVRRPSKKCTGDSRRRQVSNGLHVLACSTLSDRTICCEERHRGCGRSVHVSSGSAPLKPRFFRKMT